jgi:hypothetical protein
MDTPKQKLGFNDALSNNLGLYNMHGVLFTTSRVLFSLIPELVKQNILTKEQVENILAQTEAAINKTYEMEGPKELLDNFKQSALLQLEHIRKHLT